MNPQSGVMSGDENVQPTDVQPRVSVIIVTYGSANEIPDCIEGLFNQLVPLEVFLVDNASPDNTSQLVADYAARFENIHAILNNENIGLAAANNSPLGKCQGDYVLILNPDAQLRANSLAQMVDFLDRNPDVGVVGPKNVYADGTPHVSFHRHWGLLNVLIWRIAPYRFSRGICDRFSSYKRQDLLFVSGACLLLRRKVFEGIGGYDPEYFLTVEDACDLCIRARQTGCRVVFLPDAEVLHLTGRSGVHAPYIAVWQGYRGTVYHFLKHKGMVQALVVSLLLIVSSAARSAIAAILGVTRKQYRSVARIYATVLWNLLIHNPIRLKGWRFGTSAPPVAEVVEKRSNGLS
jgi:N-acetylglucosaminyl-diphospho-decaprenol L-rhamnosyltransferase